MCMYCKNSTTVNSTTTHVVNYKNCIIVIKNVPCLECEQCGEKYYTDEVAERLETIVNMAKKLMQEIAVIDYPQVAYSSISGEGAEAPRFSSFYLFSVLFNPSHLETFSEKVPE